MAINAMPAIDQRTCGAWNENDLTLYQHYPYYLDKAQADRKKWYPIFGKVITKKRKWKPGTTVLRVVKTNPSPDLRQFAFPKALANNARPNVDIMDVRESFADAAVYSHQFISPHFSFLPDFQDFMSHCKDTANDIMEKIDLFGEKYLRGMVFHMSPYVIVCNANGAVQLVPCPSWAGTGDFDTAAGGSGKNENWLKALFAGQVSAIDGSLAQVTGSLKVTAIEQAMTIAETDLGIPFFSGSDLPNGDDKALDGKFLWAMDSEAWNQMVYDPFVQGNLTLNFDIVTNGFKGSFFGRATTRLECRPIRFTANGTYHNPEVRVSNANNWNDQETEPNPKYTNIAGAVADCSPYAVAFLIGKNNYEALEVGPPPSLFTGDSFPDAPAMEWNGSVRLTKNFLIPCVDADGNVVWEANTFGKYLKYISEATFGIVPTQRRNIIPVIYLRRRGPQAAA
jgi:hypothetical protein